MQLVIDWPSRGDVVKDGDVDVDHRLKFKVTLPRVSFVTENKVVNILSLSQGQISGQR